MTNYKVRVQVTLSEPHDAALCTIQNLGFVADLATQLPAAKVTGELDVRNLQKLLELDAVQFIEPAK